jgi:hypothetical protein
MRNFSGIRLAAVAGMRVSSLVLLTILASGVPSYGGKAGNSADICPAYRAHLQIAREKLRIGDRHEALAELRLADRALRDCMRDDGTVALAWLRETPAVR